MLRFVKWIPVLASLVLVSTSVRATAQAEKGRIDVFVTSGATKDGVPDVAITLIGPAAVASSAQLSALYTPNAALSSDMKSQIDALIASAPIGVTADVIANAARRMESQLLGLPAPVITSQANTPAPPQVTGLTNSSGRYSFTDLAPGRYQVQALKEGYFAQAPRGLVGIGQPTVVNETTTLEVGQTSKELPIAMVRGGIISGRVRDPNGLPMSGAQIGVFQVNYQNSRAMLQQMNSRQTDDRGEYRLFWLSPGEYYIGVIPPRGPVNVPTAKDTYARTFYPGTSNPGSATRVKVLEGGESAGVDFSIRADAIGKISGRVITSIVMPNGQQATASTFYMLPSVDATVIDMNAVNFQNMASDRTNGQFEIRGVLPGSYDLVAMISANNDGPVLGRTHVDVSGAVENVVINVKAGTPVKAKLILDSGPVPYTMAPPPPTGVAVLAAGAAPLQNPAALAAPVPTPTYRVQLRSMEANIGIFDSAAQRGVTFDPSGVFTFPGVPDGRFSVMVTPILPNSYIVDVRSGARSVFDDGFEPGELSGEIEVTVSGKGAKIQGIVRDARQQPVPGARVILVPPPARRKNTALHKTGTADTNGKFTITGVAPGEYRLYSWESIQNNAWMSAEFMAPYENLGQSISVIQGSETTKDITLIPANVTP
jgi:hypothetical protein